MSDTISVFSPVEYSNEENEFLLSTLGQPPVVALRSLPATVNPNAVRPILTRVYELVELEKHSGLEWTGVEPIKEKIRIYLEKSARWKADRRRGAPRFPTMNSFDSRRRAHLSGTGSDSKIVRTYFGPAGQRIPFAIDLVPLGETEWAPEWVTADQPQAGSGLKVNNEVHRIECLICGHTEKFNPDSRQSYSLARGRISKHLRRTNEKVDEHRAAYTAEFGG